MRRHDHESKRMSNDNLTVSNVRALFGTTRRDARWHLTDELDILCLSARARFDLRQVETTGNDVVEVTVTCAFGSVDFLVPDGTMVVLDGTSFLASARSDVAAEGESRLPRIEITATTVLGRVKIVSPSHDPNSLTDDELVELASNETPLEQPQSATVSEPGHTPAVEPAPIGNPVVPKPPPAALASNGTADNPIVPKAPPNKYAIAEAQPEVEPVAAAAPVAAAQPVIPQPPANKYAVPAEQPSDEPVA